MTLVESPEGHEVEPVYKPISLVTLGFKGAGTTSWHYALRHYLDNSFLVKNSSFAFDVTGANGKHISDPTDTSPLPPQPTSTIENHTYRLQCHPMKNVIPDPSPFAIWDSPEKKRKRNV